MGVSGATANAGRADVLTKYRKQALLFTRPWIAALSAALALGIGIGIPAQAIATTVLWVFVLGVVGLMWMLAKNGVPEIHVALVGASGLGIAYYFSIYFLAPLCVVLWPTLVNFTIANLLVVPIRSRRLLWVSALLFTFVLLGLAPGLWAAYEDWKHSVGVESIVIDKVLYLEPGDRISVTGPRETPPMRRLLRSKYGIGAHDWVPGMMWPARSGEYVKYRLAEIGAVVSGAEPDVERRLSVTGQEQDGVYVLSAEIWDGSNRLARYRGVFRDKYPFEFWTNEKKFDPDDFRLRLLYLVQNSIWDMMVPRARAPETPIYRFLKAAVQMRNIKRPLHSRVAQTIYFGRSAATSSQAEDSRVTPYQQAFNCAGAFAEPPRDGAAFGTVGYRLNFQPQGMTIVSRHGKREAKMDGDAAVYCASHGIWIVSFQALRVTDVSKAPIVANFFDIEGTWICEVVLDLPEDTSRPRYSELKIGSFRPTGNGFKFELFGRPPRGRDGQLPAWTLRYRLATTGQASGTSYCH